MNKFFQFSTFNLLILIMCLFVFVQSIASAISALLVHDIHGVIFQFFTALCSVIAPFDWYPVFAFFKRKLKREEN